MILVLSACLVNTELYERRKAELTDDDGDGYNDDQGDCDDANPDIYPNAHELCDGIDQNCDGNVDNDPVDMGTWYIDEDGDGYGSTDEVTACEQPSGTVSNREDCDDGQASINPGAGEIPYDGTDQDCSGDDLVDVDEDGHDAIDAGGGDCDDYDSAVYPGRIDYSDGVDNDCVGPLDSHSPTTAHATVSGTATSVRSIGDFNGDGHTDLGIGNRFLASNAGAALVFWGGSRLGSLTQSAADLVISGEETEANLGGQLASAGDLNGDGQADLVLGARTAGTNDEGAVYVLLGGTSADMTVADADAKLTGIADGDWAGMWTASAGDLDDDGHDDLMVGAFNVDAGAADAGAIYLLYGSNPLWGDITLAESDVTFLSTKAGAHLGSCEGLGDVTGDGISDAILNAMGDDTGGPDSGTAYLILGGESYSTLEVVDDAHGAFYANANDSMASSGAAGDTNNDGYRDILLGAFLADGLEADVGKAFLVLGAPESALADENSLVGAEATFLGASKGDSLGIYVAGDGDVDADGYADIGLSVWLDDSGGADAGAGYLFMGPVAGVQDTGTADASFLGSSTSPIGEMRLAPDLDDDGYDDVLLGGDEQVSVFYGASR